jgi:hypothetical protein
MPGNGGVAADTQTKVTQPSEAGGFVDKWLTVECNLREKEVQWRHRTQRVHHNKITGETFLKM